MLLPRLDTPAAGDGTRRPDLPGELKKRGSELVLVVEDDATVRELAVRTLRAAGYGVRGRVPAGTTPDALVGRGQLGRRALDQLGPRGE